MLAGAWLDADTAGASDAGTVAGWFQAFFFVDVAAAVRFETMTTACIRKINDGDENGRNVVTLFAVQVSRYC